MLAMYYVYDRHVKTITYMLSFIEFSNYSIDSTQNAKNTYKPNKPLNYYRAVF